MIKIVYFCQACGQRSNSKRKPKEHRRTDYGTDWLSMGTVRLGFVKPTKVTCGPFIGREVNE